MILDPNLVLTAIIEGEKLVRAIVEGMPQDVKEKIWKEHQERIDKMIEFFKQWGQPK